MDESSWVNTITIIWYEENKMLRTNSYNLFSIILIFALNIEIPMEVISNGTWQGSYSLVNPSKQDKSLLLEAKLNKSSFHIGEPIQLSLIIRNDTNVTIMLIDTLSERDFDITIKDSNDVSVPRTEEGKRIKSIDTFLRREFIFIESGKEQKWREIDLIKLFELNHADSYKVVVKRSYFYEDGYHNDDRKEVSSNIIEFRLSN